MTDKPVCECGKPLVVQTDNGKFCEDLCGCSTVDTAVLQQLVGTPAALEGFPELQKFVDLINDMPVAKK